MPPPIDFGYGVYPGNGKQTRTRSEQEEALGDACEHLGRAARETAVMKMVAQ